MENLICMENCEYDIMKLDDDESSDDSLLAMQVPAHVENEVQVLENFVDINGQVGNQVQVLENGQVENQVQLLQNIVDVNGQVENQVHVEENVNGLVETQVQVEGNENVNGLVETQVQVEGNVNVNGLAIQIFEEPGNKDSTGTRGRQCRAYIQAKGRRCARMAIRNDLYCCAHFSIRKGKRVVVHIPMCGGTTIYGNSCKHRALPGRAFCKKHLSTVKKGQTSNTRRRSRKRKFEENCTDVVLAHPETPVEINPVPVEVRTPIMCGGTTIYGKSCKHRSLPGRAFCKKHLNKGQTSNTRRRTRKRKFEENCTDVVLVHPETPLEINSVSVINRGDSFSARNIIGETLMLSSADRNEIKALQWIGSPQRSNDHSEDSGFNNENGFKCKICFEEFSDDQTLGKHWIEYHEKEAHWLFRSYACAICLNSFKDKKLMETHVQERHRVQFFENSVLLICNLCGREFENMDELWIHVISSHHAELKLSEAPPEQLTLTTGNDSLQMIEYGNEASLNNNSLTPSGSQKLLCWFCGLKFDILSDLNDHRQAVHTERNVPSWVEASNRFGRRARSKLIRRSRIKNNLDVLSLIACAEGCQDDLEASLIEKYGYLPERLHLSGTEL